jgi:AcrR family transcriptional regulator
MKSKGDDSSKPGQAAGGPAAKRARIVAAATKLFAERGYAHTVVGAIAVEARVSKGLVYVHFPSKEALLGEVMQTELDDWKRATARNARVQEGTVGEVLANSFRTSIEYVRGRPLLIALLAQDPGRLLGPREYRKDAETGRGISYKAMVVPFLKWGVATGQIRKDLDTHMMARLVWMLHEALVRALFVSREAIADEDVDEMIETTVATLWSGIGSN